MGVDIENIILDDAPPNGYAPGSSVKGRLIIHSSKDTRLSSITVNITGKAKVSFLTNDVRWFKNVKYYDKHVYLKELFRGGIFGTDWKSIKIRRRLSDSSVFVGKENFCDTEQQLLGDVDIMKGESSIPFSISLPISLPSSFSCVCGSIKYKLKFKSDQSHKLKGSKKSIKEFKIRVPRDLQMLKHLNSSTFESPITHRKEKDFGFLFLTSGSISMAVTLLKSIFIPGEKIPLQVEVNNQSSVVISSIRYKFVQRTVCMGKSKVVWNIHLKDDVVTEGSSRGVVATSNISWKQLVEIPFFDPIDIEECSIIKLYYVIIVEAVAEGLHRNLVLTIPIEVVSTLGKSFNINQPQSLNADFPQPNSSNYGQPYPLNFGHPNPSNPGLPYPSNFDHSNPPNLDPPYPSNFDQPNISSTGSSYPSNSSHSNPPDYNQLMNPPNIGFVLPNSSNIGFVQPQPSAPPENKYLDSDPPPPYPGR